MYAAMNRGIIKSKSCGDLYTQQREKGNQIKCQGIIIWIPITNEREFITPSVVRSHSDQRRLGLAALVFVA